MNKPLEYSKEIANSILQRIMDGEMLTAICKEDGTPTRLTFYRWMNGREELKNDYARARLAWADFWAEKVLEVSFDDKADIFIEDGRAVADHARVQRARLQTDNIKWLDRVLSTPPTNTPISQRQESGHDSKMTHESTTAVSGGSCVSRRSIMNLLVSTAIAGTVVPTVSTATEADPIFALIDEHKKANADYYAALKVVPGTLNPDRELEELYGTREGDVRWTLTTTTPTTLTGLLALLAYIEGVSDGTYSPNGQPDSVFQQADDEMFYVIAGARECLATHLNPTGVA